MKPGANEAKGTAAAPAGADRPSGVAERLALAGLAVSSVAFVVALNLTPIANKDFWIQLKIGDLIRETGRLPETVLFSFTDAGSRPFLAYEWLSSFVWSHAFALLGYQGMIVFKCLIVVGIFALMVALSLRVNRNLLVSLALGCVCVLGINFRSTLRPELLGFFLGLVNLNLLHAFVRSGKTWWLIGLLPTSAFWANAHGSFLVNLALPAIFAVGEVIDALWRARVEGTEVDRVRLLRVSGWLFLIWLGMLGASLLNPYGVSLFEHVLKLSGSEFIRENILEWQSIFYPAFRKLPFFWIYAAFSTVLVVSIAAAFERLRPSLLMLALGFWVLTAVAVRHVPWFVIMGCYLLAHVFEETSATPRTRSSGRIPTRILSAVLLSLVLLAGVVTSATRGNVRGIKAGFGVPGPLNPNALAFIEQAGLRGNVFNSYNYGDQLIYHFHPDIRVAMDSRLDAYGADAYLEFRRLSGRDVGLLGEPQELLEFLQVHDVRAIVTRPLEYRNWAGKGHKDALMGAGWRVAYRDPHTVILTLP